MDKREAAIVIIVVLALTGIILFGVHSCTSGGYHHHEQYDHSEADHRHRLGDFIEPTD